MDQAIWDRKTVRTAHGAPAVKAQVRVVVVREALAMGVEARAEAERAGAMVVVELAEEATAELRARHRAWGGAQGVVAWKGRSGGSTLRLLQGKSWLQGKGAGHEPAIGRKVGRSAHMREATPRPGVRRSSSRPR